MMMKYIFLPIEQHSDLGFGVLGHEYKSSAQNLLKEKTPSTLLEALPILFLYRHSCELYLKSSIIILHRVLDLSEDRLNPKIKVKGKSKALFTEHSLSNLFDYFSELIVSNEDFFNQEGKTDWTNFPKELVTGIRNIEKLDGRSSYFRYPVTGRLGLDTEKSQFMEQPLDSLIPKEDEPKRISMVYLDERREPIEAYRMKDDREDVKNHLDMFEDVVSNLGGASTGLRVEYLNGY